MGARMFGRWKSGMFHVEEELLRIGTLADRSYTGAPVALAPTQDDPVLAVDPHRNNNFTFTSGDQSKCPFSGHIRKMHPRGDDNFGEDFLETRMIIRRSIPFGPEVSDQERKSGATTQERGLFFVSYQSDLANGFNFLQQSKLPLLIA